MSHVNPEGGQAGRSAGRGLGVGLPSGDDLEPAALEHRERAQVGAGRRDARPSDVGRVGLEHGRAVVASVVDGGVQEGSSDAAAPCLLRDDEAHDRPDRRVVDRGEDLGAVEAGIRLARTEAHPADRCAVRRRRAQRVARRQRAPPGRRGCPRPWSSSSRGPGSGSTCTSTTSGSPPASNRAARSGNRSRVSGRMSSAPASVMGDIVATDPVRG